MTKAFPLTVLCIVLLAACVEPTSSPPETRPTPEGTTSPITGTGVSISGWPDTRAKNMDCVVTYPDDLGERAHAFDATIEEVKVGEYSKDAGSTPVILRVRVNEAFRGGLKGSIQMRTWDFMLPAEQDVTGVRILAAAGPTLDLMGCGFTRPYSQQEASMWRATFAEE